MSATISPITYCTAGDVARFLLNETRVAFDLNSEPNRATVENYISMYEGEFDEKSHTAFRPRLVTDEVQNLRSWRGAYRELLSDVWFAVPRPIKLHYNPVLPFNSSRGHKLEVYRGDETNMGQPGSPEGTWTDVLATGSHSRQGDWWAILQNGMMHIRQTFLFRQYALFKFTYEYGKPITTLTAPVLSTDTTIPVADTWRYEIRGRVRIGQEYIFHTGKTATSLTGCIRGDQNTQAMGYDTGSEVYEVPDFVRGLITKRVAADVLSNNTLIEIVPRGGEAAPSFDSKIKAWKEEWEKSIASRYQHYELI